MANRVHHLREPRESAHQRDRRPYHGRGFQYGGGPPYSGPRRYDYSPHFNGDPQYSARPSNHLNGTFNPYAANMMGVGFDPSREGRNQQTQCESGPSRLDTGLTSDSRSRQESRVKGPIPEHSKKRKRANDSDDRHDLGRRAKGSRTNQSVSRMSGVEHRARRMRLALSEFPLASENDEEHWYDPMENAYPANGLRKALLPAGPQGAPEFMRRGSGVAVTQGAQIFEDLIRYTRQHGLRRGDIDANLFVDLWKDPEGLKRVAQAGNAFTAWVNAGLFGAIRRSIKDEYGVKRVDFIMPGAVVSGAFTTFQSASKISIKDLNRSHSQHGKLLIKHRYAVVIEVKHGRALVLITTSFKGSKKPPGSRQDKCVELVYHGKLEESDRAEDGSYKCLRYSGSPWVQRGSFLDVEKPELIDVFATPLQREGTLEADGCIALAARMELPPNNQLHDRGVRMIEQTEKIIAEREARRAQEGAADSKKTSALHTTENVLRVKTDQLGFEA